MSQLNIVILAAGKGTRMHSNQPKVLHTVGAKPILGHVIACAKSLNPHKIIVVYGFGGETVKQAFANEDIIWVNQAEQQGTGHAVQQAAPFLEADAHTLILLGDVPLIDPEACKTLVAQAEHQLAILSFNKSDPTGYGRIVRNNAGEVISIVEHKDATEQQRAIVEVNTGIMAEHASHPGHAVDVGEIHHLLLRQVLRAHRGQHAIRLLAGIHVMGHQQEAGVRRLERERLLMLGLGVERLDTVAFLIRRCETGDR